MLANISDNCLIIEINSEYIYKTQVEAKQQIHSLTVFSSLHVHKDGQIITLFSNKMTSTEQKRDPSPFNKHENSSSLRYKYRALQLNRFGLPSFRCVG